ncbi:hypothetical protein CGC58_05875 [Capnocytophaga stomatis]|uniref:DUF1700 domain-containing protein n=2 Tax=Capnocytophaga stomatis TaxID=1848904 RepID=A0A250FVW3_9FLAO|nr:hypothetical protein CGC58_05875 [Capnocytophaga stomatis]
MKPIQNMTQQEFIDFCIDKKLNGTSYRSFHDIFENYQIEEQTRKIVLEKLSEIDKSEKKILLEVEKAAYRRLGIKRILIGVAILLFGAFLLFRSMEAGVIFILNLLVILAGISFIFTGMLNILTGIVKKY